MATGVFNCVSDEKHLTSWPGARDVLFLRQKGGNFLSSELVSSGPFPAGNLTGLFFTSGSVETGTSILSQGATIVRNGAGFVVTLPHTSAVNLYDAGVLTGLACELQILNRFWHMMHKQRVFLVYVQCFFLCRCAVMYVCLCVGVSRWPFI